MGTFETFKGELAALSAAFLWALASIVYTRLGARVPPFQLNLIKGVIAIVLILLTLVVRGELLVSTDAGRFLMLALSGVLGIGVGDTAYFAALNSIGPRRTLLMETLSPAFVAILAVLFLQENLLTSAWIGILLTLFGVVWVIGERVPESGGKNLNWGAGVRWGLVAAMAQAVGAVLSRAALFETDIQPLWSTLVRLGGGVLVLLLWGVFRQQFDGIGRGPVRSLRVCAIIALTAVFSTYLGIWLQQISLKFAAAGIAQTLSSTSPLFVLPLAILLGDRISWRAIIGVFVSLSGVAFLFVL